VSGPIVIGCCGANLASLGFAFARLGFEIPVTVDPERVVRASHVILPGVGAAKDGMARVTAAGFAEVIPALKQPVLGICVGMQLLFAGSDEEDTTCLGIIDARVRRLDPSGRLPVPEMGWNGLQKSGASRLLDGVPNGGYAYFLHSYAAPVGPYTRATSDYGGAFTAVAEQDNFFGTQFHPERSSALGATVLDNFLKL
jgi:imidazole glycerol-phosphate synthase subunit HisH